MPYKPKTSIDFKEEIFGIVKDATSDHSDVKPIEPFNHDKQKSINTIDQKATSNNSNRDTDHIQNPIANIHGVCKPITPSAQKSTMDITLNKKAMHRQHYSFPGIIKDWLIDSVSILKKKRLKGISESGMLQALIYSAIKNNLDMEKIYLDYINNQL